MQIANKRFVCCLDILGFKDKVSRKEHAEVYNELLKISTARNKIEQENRQKAESKKEIKTQVILFSDSVFIFSENNTWESFKNFLKQIRYLIAVAAKENIMLKGGIAHGLISVDIKNQIYFGQPLIDAWEIQQEVNYMGVVCHFSIDDYLINSVGRKFERSPYAKTLLFQVETPLKSGKITHYNLNWFLRALDNYANITPENRENIYKDVRKMLKSFYVTVSGKPRAYIENALSVFEEIKEKCVTAELEYKKWSMSVKKA